MQIGASVLVPRGLHESTCDGVGQNLAKGREGESREVMVRIQNSPGSSSEEMGASGLLYKRKLSDLVIRDKDKEVDDQGFGCDGDGVGDIEAGNADAGRCSVEKRMTERPGSFGFGGEWDGRTKLTGESSFDRDMDAGELSFHGRVSDWGPYSPGKGKNLSPKNISPVSETGHQMSSPTASPNFSSRQNVSSHVEHQPQISSPKAALSEGAASEQMVVTRGASTPKDPSKPAEDDAVAAGNQTRHSFQTQATHTSPQNPWTEVGGVRQRRGASPRDDLLSPRIKPSLEGVKKPTRMISAQSLSRLKSKSRLEGAAPPPLVSRQKTLHKKEQASPRKSLPRLSPQRTPGTANKVEDEEDDPLKDADLPAKYRKSKLTFWSILELSTFLLILISLLCSLLVPYFRRRTLWELHLWRWVVLVMVVFSGRLVSSWAVRILVFLIEKNFLLRKRVLYFVYGLRKGVQTCLWLILVLLSWCLLFDPKAEHSTRNHRALKYVTTVLVCFVIAAFIWLAKILAVKVLASSYHVSTYFDRIQESLFNQYILESLSGPPFEEKNLQRELSDLKEEAAKEMGISDVRNAVLTRSVVTGRRNHKCGEVDKADEITIKHLQKLNQRNISAWSMKRLINVVRQTGISTLTQALDETEDDAESKDFEIESEWQAKVAAKNIFKNVAKTGMKCITLDDLTRFIPEEEASKAMNLFDGAKDNQQISKHALKNWVIIVYKERRSLALSLNDTRTAVNKLHRILNIMVSVLIIIIWLLILGLATTKILVFISSQLVLVAFIFGNTCKTIFEAIIFLFAMHPFDVGDRCVVDGVQMVVEEMNVLTTVFLRYDNEKIYYPNSVLATKPISNFYRSPDMSDIFEFSVYLSTPLERIAALKEKIASYLESKPHHWYANYTLIVKEIENMNKMQMALGVRHAMNHQDFREKRIRRSDLILEIKKYFEELDIKYHLLPQEIFLHHV